MNSQFFNKYRDLFGVDSGVPLPSSKLTLNHRLFIDEPYLPAYTEEFKLNNKIIQMKRDYTELDRKIQQLLVESRAQPSPTISHKGISLKSGMFSPDQRTNAKQSVKKPSIDQIMALKDEVEHVAAARSNKYPRKSDTKNSIHQSSSPGASIPSPPIARPVSTKLSNIFQSENENIVKQSQLNYVFGYKLQEPEPYKAPERRPSDRKPTLSKNQILSEPPMLPKIQQRPSGNDLHQFRAYPVNNNIFRGQEEENQYNQAKLQNIIKQKDNNRRVPKKETVASYGSKQQSSPIIQPGVSSWRDFKPTRVSQKQALDHRKEAKRRQNERREKLKNMLKRW